jgi:hypothetical protein
VDKRFFGFLPQGQSGFLNFQVQVNNDFIHMKDKKEALPLGYFDIFTWVFCIIKRIMGAS